MGGMRGALPRQDSVLSFPAFGKAGDHRLGTGKLSLRRKRTRRDAEANLRSVLHPALFPQARCHDRSEDDLYDVRRKGPLKGGPFLRTSVISYRLSDGGRCALANLGDDSAPPSISQL